MSTVRPTFLAVACALALTACADSGSTPATNPDLQPGPTDSVLDAAPDLDHPFLDDYTLPEDDSRAATHNSDSGADDDPACNQRFKLNLFVAGEGDRPDWHGEGRLRLNPCVSPFADHDGMARVRLPDINRGVEVQVHKQDDSTEDTRHYVGRKLRGGGRDQQASIVMWEIDAYVTQHSVHPHVRTNGTVTRVRTRWFLDRDGNLSTQDDELTASFTGLPTSHPEPKQCKDL